MARTITTKPAQVSSKVQDPYAQPCFAVYSCQHSVHGCGWLTLNHNLEMNSMYMGDGNSAYNRFRTYTSYSPEFFNNYASSAYFETQGHPGSSSEYGSNTCNVGYLGHQNFHSANEYSKTAGYVIADAGRQRRGDANRDCAPIVNEPDQDYAIFLHHNSTTGTWFQAGTRSATRYYSDFSQSSLNRFNIPIQAGSNHYGMYGSGCYNKKLNKFLIIEHNHSSHVHTPVVWNDCPDLRSVALQPKNRWQGTNEQFTAYSSQTGGNIYSYFQDSNNCTVYSSSTTGMNSYSGQDESYWRTIPVLCDNGKVTTFSMTPSNGCVVQRWNANGTFEGVLWNGSWTTSYGYEQGSRFGARWQVSTSGKYLWAYCPSYYYGSGAYWICVRVSDGKFVKFQTNDSTHGRTMAPLGMNKMIWTYSHNSDSDQRGLRFKIWELDYYMHTLNDGDTLSLDDNWSDYLIDCMTNSTDYSFIIPAQYNTSLFHTQLESNA